MQALHLGLYVGLAFIAGYVATNAATLPGISAAAARAKTAGKASAHPNSKPSWPTSDLMGSWSTRSHGPYLAYKRR